MKHPIDFVVTWLDSSDPEWQRQYNEYKGVSPRGDSSVARFRDWDLFKYWFRAVETNAPWVNRVFLITNGTVPKWIRRDHPKLVLVNHEDYIPSQFLPTFNSCTIELHINKIKQLSEHFVYFNDDCYINNPVTPEYYFVDGLPCDNNAETIFNTTKYNPLDRFFIRISMFVDICVLNRHFNRNEVWRQSKRRWLGKHLSNMSRLASLLLIFNKWNLFVGFNWKHVEQPFLKSVMDEAWEKEPEMLNESCTRFRREVTLNPYFFRYWQFATNRFYPVKLDHVAKYRTIRKDVRHICRALKNKKILSLCINDTPRCTEEEFEDVKKELIKAFEEKYPNKSSFEL